MNPNPLPNTPEHPAQATGPTALVADDEPLLRDSLVRALAQAWPELQVLGQARNGREAVEKFEQLRPDIVFLDVHMPGINGVEAARQLARRAHIVFVTAYEQYAVQAFEQGALDYLVKPVEEARLADTVARLKQRFAEKPQQLQQPQAAEQSAAALDAVLAQLLERLHRSPTASAAMPSDAVASISSPASPAGPFLQWIRASVGASLKLIPVDEIIYLRSDEKYTLVVWPEGEALIRTPIRELMEQIDPQRFAQVHRSVVVNLHAISHVTRGPNETADVHLKARPEVLPVSRSYLHLFRQM
ncbi:LytR/AlgR family response regulator transcription factor [Paucibacter sp. DJ2R-2]|uniref:LytR/AlgR family response regulator transcription factor n=1 Tax=Paucibacter sp. DJ2R-2 TaxID=2893558 RepID=UPI0021E366F1|nr:LytTR family DNA-binding domain-containing protein [Paucibacter sp. DJ2R-2]MCV2422665.1 LytTR family DNA-binding domain-containing protein [Paucibacter sp. DJ4R-1]MCV2438863.1 LytTR family DNA-binding domain-containing protein [Paucibacter sp. DJ2R-2]